MALRSVVVDPATTPPPSRRSVVVRAGGPAPKGRLLDTVIGVVGTILLIAAIGLAWYLPDRTYLNPQFRLSFTEANGEFGGSLDHLFASDGEVQDFEVDVPQDNVKSIKLIMGFDDDVFYSMPDSFKIQLIAPNGTQVGPDYTMENPAPRAGAGPTDVPITEGAQLEQVINTAPPLSEQIVTGLAHTENEAQALARLEPQYRVATAGKWIVRVTMTASGDCPGPGEGYNKQPADCRFGTPNDPSQSGTSGDGSDNGNLFLLAGFTYTFYSVTVQELK